jgi:formylglycine-generating enzyme required for sulfatase activity
VFLCVSIILAVAIPTPTVDQARTFKITLALAAAGIAAGIPGLLNLEMSSGKLLAIKGTGAFAAFLIVFFFNPVSGSPASSTAASHPDLGQVASALFTPSAIAMSPQGEPTKPAIVELAPTLTEGKATPNSLPATNSTAVSVPIPATATPSPTAIPGLTITDPIGMELVAVPDGHFLMGSEPTLDDQAKPDEQPSHSVNLAKFYIGKHEVTNIQYAAFLAATAHTPPPQWASRLPKGEERYPVVGITWYDAIAFADWLSRTTHREFRLPTEAEWEKACRGTDGGIYPWGGTPPSAEMANFGGRFNRTTPAGAYSPTGDSAYRATDMAGNVWEYTASLWGQSQNEPAYVYPYVSSDGREALDAPVGMLRVLRGGAYGDNDIRCARRIGYKPDGTGYQSTGFRVVMTP